MRRRITSSAGKKALVTWAILALALSPQTAALAATGKGTTTTGSIKITQKISHTAYAYQIFDGDVEADGSISDIQWGSGVDETRLLAALGSSSFFSTATDARGVAEILSVITYNPSTKTWVSSVSGSSLVTGTAEETDKAKEFAEIVSRCLKAGSGILFTGNDQPTASGLDDGWYVVASDYGTDPAEGAALLFPGLITVGSGQSSVTPKESAPTFRKEVQEDSNGTWQKYADFEIGQTFQQRLVATIGDADLRYYKNYYLGFYDTLPAGQDITDLSKVTVKVGNNDITNKFTKTYNNHILEVNAKENILNDISAGAEVIVSYETVLTSSAKIGSAGNVNTAKLTYSADPRTTPSGTPEIRSTITPEDGTTAYTYELKLTKTDSKDTNKTLAGAKFSLRRSNGDYAVLSVYGGTTSDNSTANNTGNQHVVVTGWVGSTQGATYVTTGSDGTASIAGLDSGDTYTLNEAVAPDGYDLDTRDISVLITANPATSNAALTNLSVSVSGGTPTNGDISTGVVSMGATNVKAPILPTTGLGGIATSVLLGSGLVAVSATVIATQASRKRKE